METTHQVKMVSAILCGCSSTVTVVDTEKRHRGIVTKDFVDRVGILTVEKQRTTNNENNRRRVVRQPSESGDVEVMLEKKEVVYHEGPHYHQTKQEGERYN